MHWVQGSFACTSYVHLYTLISFCSDIPPTSKKLWTASYELQKKIHSTNHGKHLTSTSKCTTPDFFSFLWKSKGKETYLPTSTQSTLVLATGTNAPTLPNVFLLSSCIPFLLFHNKVNLRKGRGERNISVLASLLLRQGSDWKVTHFRQRSNRKVMPLKWSSDWKVTEFR